MGDIDGFSGLTVWASESEDALFSEYVVATHAGDATIQSFATVAFFDRKMSIGAIEGRPGAPLSLAYQLDMLVKLGAAQARMPRFFYVLGEAIPWTLIEVDIQSRQRAKPIQLFGDAWHWRQTWAQLGLVALRDDLARWLALC